MKVNQWTAMGSLQTDLERACAEVGITDLRYVEPSRDPSVCGFTLRGWPRPKGMKVSHRTSGYGGMRTAPFAPEREVTKLPTPPWAGVGDSNCDAWTTSAWVYEDEITSLVQQWASEVQEECFNILHAHKK